MPELSEVKRRIESIDGLVQEIEKLTDPAAQSLARQLVQSLMDLHGAGLDRMLEIVHRSGEQGQEIVDELGRDELVRSLLLLYGLHPLDLSARVAQALEVARPSLKLHGAGVELVSISDAGLVTVRMDAGSGGSSCGSSAAKLQAIVEQAIYDAAPDIAGLVVEGLEQSSSASAFVSVASLTMPHGRDSHPADLGASLVGHNAQGSAR